jgi:tetratricopeptide (TPR) repeat protein
MKIYYKNPFLIFLLVVTVYSCDENLNIEPEQNLTPEAALGTPENIQNILVGAYDLAGRNQVFAGSYNLASELLANENELAWRGTFLAPAEFNRKQMTIANGFVSDYWIFSYAVSNQTNLILENLDKFDNQEEADRVEGEARFLRALVYFELVRFFALPYEAGQNNSQLGVPIVTVGVSDASQIEFPERNSVQEVYDFITTDLTLAVSLLPNQNPIEPYYANRFSAEALLSRVYLQQGDYPNARETSNNVISQSPYQLTSDYSSAFNNDGNVSEDIFSWQITTQDGINDNNTFWSTREFGGRSLTGDVTVEGPYFDNFNGENDTRSEFFYEGNGTLSTTKWQSQFANVPFLRLAEIFLIRAEANLRLTSTIGATPQEDLNVLRARAEAPLFTTSVTIEDILNERKRELAFEGFFFHDKKRLQETIDGLPYNSNVLVLPIPQREVDSNPNLVQNPGYTN